MVVLSIDSISGFKSGRMAIYMPGSMHISPLKRSSSVF